MILIESKRKKYENILKIQAIILFEDSPILANR